MIETLSPQELSDCPFCDGFPSIRAAGFWPDNSPVPPVWIACGCGARSGDEVSEAEAIAAWNRRASSPAPPGEGGGCTSERAATPQERRPADVEPSAAWRPIETAPKDGTDILLFCPQGDGATQPDYRVTMGHWLFDPGGVTEYRDGEGRWTGQDERDGFEGWLSWDGGFSEETMMPTHWMPRPPPPATPPLEEMEAEGDSGSETLHRDTPHPRGGTPYGEGDAWEQRAINLEKALSQVTRAARRVLEAREAWTSPDRGRHANLMREEAEAWIELQAVFALSAPPTLGS